MNDCFLAARETGVRDIVVCCAALQEDSSVEEAATNSSRNGWPEVEVGMETALPKSLAAGPIGDGRFVIRVSAFATADIKSRQRHNASQHARMTQLFYSLNPELP